MNDPSPDIEMQALAATAAAEIARRQVEWICEGDHQAQIGGPIYRQIEGVATAVIMDALRKQDAKSRMMVDLERAAKLRAMLGNPMKGVHLSPTPDSEC